MFRELNSRSIISLTRVAKGIKVHKKGGIIIIVMRDVNPFDMNLPESSVTPDDPRVIPGKTSSPSCPSIFLLWFRSWQSA